MERKVLVDEIADFCVCYGLFKKSDSINAIKERIERGLEDSDFLESLINTIMLKTKKRKNIDIERLKGLLLELEKVRLEQEYKEQV